MSDHPNTFKGNPEKSGKLEWDDHATLHRVDDGNGVLADLKALRRGTFADMIRYLTLLPEEDRRLYVIEKAGDRKYTATEAMALATRDDFPSGE